ncbi:hypothetical protein HMPREF0766_14207 [Sphingobacterium spiritivorum ATCC 33861]|uniref:Uncharacterized protein n=1 Tax=Sphingobacterium spiritivorum ATCC 33861 TaxID=525373 RepID=D7VTA3_SPHSI|nr:hypothetical protein HMPREF0766_14207 [Sphingobacterium spiritivorum ATCC 33861]
MNKFLTLIFYLPHLWKIVTDLYPKTDFSLISNLYRHFFAIENQSRFTSA